MKQVIYLVATCAGVQRMTRRPPDLGRGEIGVALTVSIPASAFKNPLIAAKLDVQDTHVIEPTVEIAPVETTHGQDENPPQAAEAPDQ